MTRTTRRPTQTVSHSRGSSYGGAGRSYGPATAPAHGHGEPAIPSRGKKGLVPAVGIGVVLVAAVVVAILAGALKNADEKSYYSNKITAGVTIDGKDVSGRDTEELKEQLKSQYQQKIDGISIKITYQDQKWPLTAADLGVTEDVEDIVSQAALLARTGSLEQRRTDARKIKAEGHDFTITLSMDQNKLKIKLNEIASAIAKPGRDATVAFNPNIDFAKPDQPTQEEINSMFTINPEVAGLTVDVDMMTKKITEDLKDDWKAEQKLIVNQYVPKTTADSLRQSFHLISTFYTHISSVSTKERVNNITVALGKFNGYVLYPGEELSFNDTTGPRNEANGYQMAHVINNNTYVDDWGGGVCQASTTLYNAALLAGCEITDRGHHSIPSDYVPLGFDAMVNYPNGDLKFKNAGTGPLYIKSWVTKKRNAYVMIFGNPLPDGQTITLENDVLYKGPLPLSETKVDADGTYSDFVTYTDDTYEVMKPHPAIKVDTYIVYKDKNGNEISRKKLFHDEFKEIPGLIVTGKEVRTGGNATPPPGDTGGTGDTVG